MASSNAVDDKQQPYKRQQFKSSGMNRPIPIRNIYVGYIERNMIDDIKGYFERFGEIESVILRSEDIWTHWCLVQFKRQEDAEAALSRTGKRWQGHAVRAAYPWHQPDHPLRVAPGQNTDSNISVALKDDCLQEIFNRLKLSDLTNVAGVSKRFNEQAKKTFVLKHKHLVLNEQFNYNCHEDLIETAMKHFGKDTHSLSIDANLFTKKADAIHLIGQNCGTQLKQLELRNFRLQTDSRSLRPIFAQIEQLKLQDCASSIYVAELMAGCGELTTLSLSFSNFWVQDNCEYILGQTFPKLQECSFSCYKLRDEVFQDFVIRHPSVTKLSIEYAQLTPHLLHTIGKYAKKLQELEFVQIYDANSGLQNDAAYIGQLSSLKKLQLEIKYSIVPVLNALIASEVPIESMRVGFTCQPDVDHAIKCITQFKQIKMLRLRTFDKTRRVTDKDVIELAECLPELEELHLDEVHGYNSSRSDYEFKSQLSTIGLRKMLMHSNKLKLLKLRSIESIKIDVDDYMSMLSTVQKRKEKGPMVIEILGTKDQVDVPAPVLTENRSTFNIKLKAVPF